MRGTSASNSAVEGKLGGKIAHRAGGPGVCQPQVSGKQADEVSGDKVVESTFDKISKTPEKNIFPNTPDKHRLMENIVDKDWNYILIYFLEESYQGFWRYFLDITTIFVLLLII